MTKFPPGLTSRVATRAVPGEVGAFIKQYGVGEFGRGILWMVNPIKSSHLLSDFEGGRIEHGSQICARTAFADLITFTPSLEFHFLDTQSGEVTELGPSFADILNTQLATGPLRSKLRPELFYELVDHRPGFLDKLRGKTLAKLTDSTCYRFKQPLAQGGAPKLANVEVAELSIHLARQSQVLDQLPTPDQGSEERE